MAQYIDKAIIVAEIEKRRKDWHYGSSIEAKYKREECNDILSLINTFEVKEVNLINKACVWLTSAFHQNRNGTFNYAGGNDCNINDIINVFKQAMKE